MGVETGNPVASNLCLRIAKVGDGPKLAHIHAVNLMLCHGGIYVRRHRAQVLANDLGVMPMRFQAQNRVEFLGTITDVESVRGGEAARNPIKPM